MKKIFLLALSLPLLICGRFYYDPDRFMNDVGEMGDSIAAKMHTFVERDHENYWLNNIRTFRSYPINWYGRPHYNPSDANSTTQTRLTHEYPRNVPIHANVGQRLVDLETYNVQTSNIGEHYEATQTGEITNSGGSISLYKGQVLTPLGEVTINGRYFTVYEPERDGRLLLADETGLFFHNIGIYYRGELVLSEDITTMNPKTLGVKLTSDVKQSTSSPQMHYEVIYNGWVDDDNMEFIYVDYSAGRVSKTFVFPREQQIVNVNGVHIKVLNAGENDIEYILLN